MKKIIFDANFWIYLSEGNEEFKDICKEILKICIKNEYIIGVPTLIYTECLSKPFKENNLKAVGKYHSLFNKMPNSSFIDVDKNIAISAASIRVKYGIPTPDAILLSCYKQREYDYFITNDKHLLKHRIKGVYSIPQYYKEML